MRIGATLLAVMLALPATAGEKAAFIDGTFATAEGCDKLKRIAAGTPRNVETVPETLTAEGYESWEGGCSFTTITETKRGMEWKVTTACSEGEEEWSDTETFELVPGSGRLKVTVDGKTTEFQRCDGGKGN